MIVHFVTFSERRIPLLTLHLIFKDTYMQFDLYKFLCFVVKISGCNNETVINNDLNFEQRVLKMRIFFIQPIFLSRDTYDKWTYQYWFYKWQYWEDAGVSIIEALISIKWKVSRCWHLAMTKMGYPLRKCFKMKIFLSYFKSEEMKQYFII